jgi:hypothetical protein
MLADMEKGSKESDTMASRDQLKIKTALLSIFMGWSHRIGSQAGVN